MEKPETPQEVKIDALLQMVACLIDRLGGEVVISQKEYSMYEGVPVVGRNLTSGYVAFRLGDEDGELSLSDIDRIPDPDPSL